MIFLWYPKCSTCRKAKDWLVRNGIRFEERDIKEQNPTEKNCKPGTPSADYR